MGIWSFKKKPVLGYMEGITTTTGVNAYKEALSKEAVLEAVATSVGRLLNQDHRYDLPPIGRVISAEAVSLEKGGIGCKCKWEIYVHPDTVNKGQGLSIGAALPPKTKEDME